jgi:hypothetical protein
MNTELAQNISACLDLAGKDQGRSPERLDEKITALQDIIGVLGAALVDKEILTAEEIEPFISAVTYYRLKGTQR